MKQMSMKYGQKICIFGILVLLSGLLLAGSVSATEFGPWSLETVAGAGSVGEYSSLALDGAGHPAISYYDQTNADLKYAAWDGSRWVIETVDGSRRVGEYSSLALDGAGHPAISYYDQTNADLKYAAWDGDRWVIETVDGSSRIRVREWYRDHGCNDVDISSSGKEKDHGWNDRRNGCDRAYHSNWNVGKYSSLALDSSGNPRISYYDQTNRNLKYAAWDGSRWVISTVDSSGSVGEYSSLALDSSGNPRISYYDQTGKNLKYAAREGNVWVIATVDSSRNVGQYSSLAVDGSGRPQISYYDQARRDLKHAAWDGSRWILSTVDSSKRVGEYTSLRLDTDGDPCIAYYDITRRDLKFAAWNRTASAWMAETVDSSGKVGLFASLALDPLGNPRISYYDLKNRDLKFAAGTGHAPTLPAPTVTGIRPSNGVAGTLASVTDLAGTNFVPGTVPAVRLMKTGAGTIAGTNVTVVSPTRISCTLPLPTPSATSAGRWDVVVRNADGQSATLASAFTVTNPAPAVTGITPKSGTAGILVIVTNLSGTNFIAGTTPDVWLVKAGAGGIVATNVTVISPTRISCTLPLPDPSATTSGQWDVVVRNTDGQSGTLASAFTVTNPPPSLTGITPNRGIAGTLVYVQNLKGTNFPMNTTPVVWLKKSGEADILATDVAILTSTRITCYFLLPATTSGQWDVVIRTPDGQIGSKAAAFTVVAPSFVWDWSDGGWDGWEHAASWTGSCTGHCSEYGPIVSEGHGLHGITINMTRGQTEASVWKTFQAPSGTGWDALTFRGLLSSSDRLDGRWMIIEVNGDQVFGATAEPPSPLQDGQPFAITASFPYSDTVTVRISHGQNPAWGGCFTLQYDSLTLGGGGAPPMTLKSARVPAAPVTPVFVKPDGSRLVGNETDPAR